MPTFQSKPFNKQALPIVQKVKKHPFALFGLPFIAIMVGASFGLAQLTQTKMKVEKEEALGLDKNRRSLSIQEEYWRLQAKTEDEWEQVRIDRPAGVEE
ncbi:unnamed protein product [Cunninghamella echinulata]